MGSGKTHWGTRIAEKLKIPFYDLDAVIVNGEGMTISEIFTIKGEEYFRYMEKQTLKIWLPGKKILFCLPAAEHLAFSIILIL
jgi:shikimate kinase